MGLKSRFGLLSRWGSAVAALAVGLAGWLSVTESTSAAGNSDVVLRDAALVHVDAQGNPVGRDVVWVGDHLRFDVSFDATSANPQPGDEFTVALPSPLFIIDAETRKPLKTLDGVTGGDCGVTNSANQSTLSCRFNEAIVGKSQVKGTVSAMLWASAVTETNSVEVDLNGVITPVELPYAKAVAERPQGVWTAGTNPGKYSQEVGSASTGISWTIYAPGPWVVDHYALGEPIVVEDHLTPGVLFPELDLSQHVMSAVCLNPKNPTQPTNTVLARADGYGVNGYSYTVRITDGHKVTMTATGPWSPDCDYTLGLRTTFANGSYIDKSMTYENTASFVGKQQDVYGSRKYRESFNGTISYLDGHGGFSIIKRVQGDDAEAVSGQHYGFDYRCDDGQSGTVVASAQDGPVAVGRQFRDGVNCTITEVNGARAGYELADVPAQQVRIVAGKAIPVEFVNTYTKSVPSPTEEPSPTPSVEPSSVPSAGPSPSAAPSGGSAPSPSEASSPTPSVEPSPVPSAGPSPSEAPSPEVIPSSGPTPAVDPSPTTYLPSANSTLESSVTPKNPQKNSPSPLLTPLKPVVTGVKPGLPRTGI